jgi:phosphoesterase RecJ-like protein
MSEYSSNATIKEIATRVRAAKTIVITSHARPDGDALGSCLALARGLATIGVDAAIYLEGSMDQGLMAVAGSTEIHNLQKTRPPEDAELLIVVDTGAWAQLPIISETLRVRHDDVIIIDHHAKGDEDVAPMRFVDATAGSCTMVVKELLDAMSITIGGEAGGVGEALFLGMATDTGWFRHSNADARVFEVASELLGVGVDKTRLYALIEETSRPQRLAIQARALMSLSWHCQGKVAMMQLTKKDFAETGARSSELYGTVNFPLAVAAAQVACLLTDIGDGVIKISMRSKTFPGGIAEAPLTDVATLTGHFGGGGHIHAAGARFSGSLDEAATAILGVIEGVAV